MPFILHHKLLNKRLFTIIALLVLICCILHALGVEDVFWIVVLGVLGAVATIVMFISWVSGKIADFINGAENDLEGMEKALGKLRKQKSKHMEAPAALLKELAAVEKEVADLKSSEYDADLNMIEKWKLYQRAEQDVQNKSTALSKATKDFDEHVKNCYYCQQMSDCSTADYLLYCKNASAKDLEYAKRGSGIAKNNYEAAASDWNKKNKELKKLNRRLSNLKADKGDFEEAFATLLNQIDELEGDIADKESEIERARKDLQVLENAKDAAPDYIGSFKDAQEAGEDMEEWIEENPPPDSVKELLEDYNEIQETY